MSDQSKREESNFAMFPYGVSNASSFAPGDQPLAVSAELLNPSENRQVVPQADFQITGTLSTSPAPSVGAFRKLAPRRLWSDRGAANGTSPRCFYYPGRTSLIIVEAEVSFVEFLDRYVHELSMIYDHGRNFRIGCPVNHTGKHVTIRVRSKANSGIWCYVETSIKKCGNTIHVQVMHYDYLGVRPAFMKLGRLGMYGSGLAMLGSCLVPALAIPVWLLGGLVFIASGAITQSTVGMPIGHKEESLSLKMQCLACLRRATYGLDPGSVTWSMAGDGISGGF